MSYGLEAVCRMLGQGRLLSMTYVKISPVASVSCSLSSHTAAS